MGALRAAIFARTSASSDDDTLPLQSALRTGMMKNGILQRSSS